MRGMGSPCLQQHIHEHVLFPSPSDSSHSVFTPELDYHDSRDQDMLEVAKGMLSPDGSKIKIRIGIHTGPAYFGIVGVKCPKYTLIGDTVNIGSAFPWHAAAVFRARCHSLVTLG